MNKHWKRTATASAVLALSSVIVFASAAFAQGNGPANQAQLGNQAAPVMAQANRNGPGGGTGTPGRGAGINWADADGDGICDNWIDADGDGVCDNCDGTQQSLRNGRQSSTGGGANWIDADGDGVCDNCGGTQQAQRNGRQASKGGNATARGGRMAR